MSDIKHTDDQNWSAKTVLTEQPVAETVAADAPWSNEQANKDEPHLRDVLITVDGLNVVDFHFPAGGAWTTRFNCQLSGDMGVNPKTGKRYVIEHAADLLEKMLLDPTNVMGHCFLPHANISRENQSEEIEAAVKLTCEAIASLRSDDLDMNGVNLYNNSLHIVVQTVNFELIERKILSEAAWNQLQDLINAEPSNVTDDLSKLMLRTRGYVVRGLDAGDKTTVADEPVITTFADGVHINTTKLFDGIQHKALKIPTTAGAVDIVTLWIVSDYDGDIKSLDDVGDDERLTLVSDYEGKLVEWRLL